VAPSDRKIRIDSLGATGTTGAIGSPELLTPTSGQNTVPTLNQDTAPTLEQDSRALSPSARVLTQNDPTIAPNRLTSVPPPTITTLRLGQSAAPGRSLGAGLALSALVPGLGHRWLGHDQRGRTFLWADAVLWGSLWGSLALRERAIDDARSYAGRYAGATGAPRNTEYLQLMADYRSRSGLGSNNSSPVAMEDYNQDMIRQGREVDEEWANDAAHQWDWGSPEAPANHREWEAYRDLIRDYRLTQIAFQASVGALVLDRLFAMVDLLRLYRAGGDPTRPFALPRASVQPRAFAPGVDVAVRF
jgi:hypothetical protein